jgi:hypothetical protein
MRSVLCGLVAASLTICGVSACAAGFRTHSVATSLLPVPPPAVSGIDKTVYVRWQLADSFDVFPDGKCAGRSGFREMAAGARVQLRGDTTGLSNETRATARFERQVLRGKRAMGDDGLYCVIEAVFAPSMPDPDGYWLKFAGSRRAEQWLGKPGSPRPFGQPDPPPGYGSYNIGSQLCPALLDPPYKDCS